MAALGSEDWCDAIHAGVFLTADRPVHTEPSLRVAPGATGCSPAAAAENGDLYYGLLMK